MPILGSQLSKIEAKKGDLEREVRIKTNVEITDVRKKGVSIGNDVKTMLNFHFRFTANYNESTSILIEGVTYYADEEKKMDELLAKWKKDKKLDTETILPVLNQAMEIGYIQAIGIAEKLKLPSPMKMPKFIPQDKKE